MTCKKNPAAFWKRRAVVQKYGKQKQTKCRIYEKQRSWNRHYKYDTRNRRSRSHKRLSLIHILFWWHFYRREYIELFEICFCFICHSAVIRKLVKWLEHRLIELGWGKHIPVSYTHLPGKNRRAWRKARDTRKIRSCKRGNCPGNGKRPCWKNGKRYLSFRYRHSRSGRRYFWKMCIRDSFR